MGRDLGSVSEHKLLTSPSTHRWPKLQRFTFMEERVSNAKSCEVSQLPNVPSVMSHLPQNVPPLLTSFTYLKRK